MALEDFNQIKDVLEKLDTERPSRFGYTEAALESTGQDEIDNIEGTFVINDSSQKNSIPDADQVGVADSIVSTGLRTQAATIPRMAVNHFFGRFSMNIIKIVEKVKNLVNEHLVNRYITPSGEVLEKLTVEYETDHIKLIQHSSPLDASAPITSSAAITLLSAEAAGNAGLLSGADKTRLDSAATLSANSVQMSGVQIIDGQKTFTTIPKIPTDYPTEDSEVMSKKSTETLFNGIDLSTMNFLAMKTSMDMQNFDGGSLATADGGATWSREYYLPFYKGWLFIDNQHDSEVTLMFVDLKGNQTFIQVPIWYNVDSLVQNPENGDIFFLSWNSGITAAISVSKMTDLFSETYPTITEIYADASENMNGLFFIPDGSGNLLVRDDSDNLRLISSSGELLNTLVCEATSYESSDTQFATYADFNGVPTLFATNGNKVYYSQDGGFNWDFITTYTVPAVTYAITYVLKVIDNTLIIIVRWNIPASGSSTVCIYHATDFVSATQVYEYNSTTYNTLPYYTVQGSILFQVARGYATAGFTQLKVSFDKGVTWKVLKTTTTNYSTAAIKFQDDNDGFAYLAYSSTTAYELNLFTRND